MQKKVIRQKYFCRLTFFGITSETTLIKLGVCVIMAVKYLKTILFKRLFHNSCQEISFKQFVYKKYVPILQIDYFSYDVN